ncbi:hypothetical protein KGF57_001264 [Candida theae]|uniref:Manganese/iron superoxide dismutase C-terminal domain-containing protein n=1 Tax=Candida theae TaxID=1198502 RepID=A0AAD5BHA7_9ASCO|nr:uncharacterized protein KGF57_001264 [Candida theae]KAI5963386.1 hypothetical protein KGF57_001264 [Candida theae]
MFQSLKAKRTALARHIRPISTSFSLPINKTLEVLKATDANFEGLFSHSALDQLWFKQGNQLIQNLNQHLIQASNLEDKAYTLPELVAATINKPELYHIHKNASKLHNLHQFFENLRPLQSSAPFEITRPSASSLLETPNGGNFGNTPTDEVLLDWINHSFGSVVEFRTLLINTAKAIKGDGSVWLVAESTVGQNYLNRGSAFSGFTSTPAFHNLAIVVTYNGGTVDDSERSGQIRRMKSVLEGEATENEEERDVTSKDDGSNDALKLGTAEQADLESSYLNKKLIPALTIDASPRNYLVDYGVFGKQKYLENCWECIDWDVVLRRLPPRSKQAISV